VWLKWFATTSSTPQPTRRTIDFVEEQDSNMYMSFLGYYYTPSGSESFHTEYPADAYTPDMIAAADEAWHKAYAYGNIVNFGPNTPTSQAPIHFFGDQSPYGDENTNPPVRVGNLFDYNNTFYSVGGNSLHLVDTMQNQDNQIRWEWPTLTLWNNAMYRRSAEHNWRIRASRCRPCVRISTTFGPTGSPRTGATTRRPARITLAMRASEQAGRIRGDDAVHGRRQPAGAHQLDSRT
jgi:hypothetical protein